MFVADVHDYSPPEADVVKTFLSENRQKNIKAEIERVVDEEFGRLEEYANEHISQVAASRAEQFFERVLAGDDAAAMALVGDRTGGSRHRLIGCEDGEPWASLIHGRLFETGGIELRRKLVEAHPELIRNERIADLESIVDGLTKQIHKLSRDLEMSRQGYSP